MFKWLTVNVIRNKNRSFLVMLLSFLFMIFVGVYLGNITENEELLNALGERLPVTAAITDPSGSRDSGLQIGKWTVEKFTSLGMKDCKITAESYGTLDYSVEEPDRKITLFIMGANVLSAFELGDSDISIAKEEAEGLFEGGSEDCLVDREYFQSFGHDLEIGDELEIDLYLPIYNEYDEIEKYKQLSPTKIRVAGFFTGTPCTAYANQPHILCSLSWLEKMYDQMNEHLIYTSVKGMVANPLKLNEIKVSAKENYLPAASANSLEDRKGNSLLIDDSIYIQTATQLISNINMLRFFLPFVTAMTVALEIVVFFFAMRSRVKDIYILRCLGKGKGAITL